MFKKVLIYILILFSITSCELKPLHLQGDTALKINVQVQADISVLWKAGWKDTLKYNWDENLYGPLFYTLPTSCNVIIFKDGRIINESKVQTGKRELIDVELDNTYDLLIYSKMFSRAQTYYDGGRYYVETTSTTGKASNNDISKQYETVDQPGEIFAMNKKQIHLSNDISDFEEVIENGKLVYVYNIDEQLEPVSYIYLIQFMVVNDDNSPYIEARDITNFTISGISTKKNMFTNKPVYTGNKQISTYDVKPGQMINDTLVFVSRVTILDLLPDDVNSSWTSQLDYLYYSNIDVDTYDYGEVTGTKDITQQLRENPKGGIINIIIYNSELKKEKPTEGSNSFGFDLNEWKQHIYDVF